MISVVLFGTENPGNLGAVARVMKNFGFSELLLVDPKVSIDDEVRARAVHAQDVLDKAKIVGKNSLKEFDLVVASTARLGDDYNLPRSALSLEQVNEKISALDCNSRVAVVFGPESCGLTNLDIELADFVFTINTSEEYSSLNLSHAVAVTLYSLANLEKRTDRFTPITPREKEEIFKILNERLDSLTFKTDSEKLTQVQLWKNIIGKATLTKREAYALLGFLKKP